MRMGLKEDNIGAKFFKADDEDDFMDTENETFTVLSWREDPEATHSDWTIVVSTEADEDPRIFHVHKNILSVGPRSCMYFTALFRTNLGVAEKEDSTSQITLGNHEAEAFPIFLDFVYSHSGNLEAAATENAVALRSLARYFRCRELIKSVNDFIQEDISEATAAIYLRYSVECNDDKLEQSTRKLILEHYGQCSGLERLLVELFRSIVCSPDLDVIHHSDASMDIAKYFLEIPYSLNACLLNELTSPLSVVV